MYRTWLIPYLEGALDAERRRQLEARLAEDADLAAELAALRRAEPRLRRAVAHLRQTEAVTVTPLWPGLRGRLAARPARGPALWWLGGGICTASAVLFAFVALGPGARPTRQELDRGILEARRAPVLVGHRNNATGTRVAAKLRKRADRVAAVKRAAEPRLAAGGRPATFQPVTPPFAPPLPVLAAGKRPMPVIPPFQMAKRDMAGDRGVTDGVFPPAPTHSLLPSPGGTRAEDADKKPSPFPTFDDAPHPALRRPPLPPARATPAPAPASSDLNGVYKNAASGAAAQSGTFADAGDAPAAPSVLARAGGAKTQRQAGADALNATGDAAPPSLRRRLERTVTPPLFGTADGAQQQQRLLQEAAPAGALDALATELEQEPVEAGRAAAQETLNARLLAAIYEQSGDEDRALAERRRAVLLPTADGEDWFELAQTETRLGNAASAQRAYAQALRAPGPPLSPAHRAVARQKLL